MDAMLLVATLLLVLTLIALQRRFNVTPRKTNDERAIFEMLSKRDPQTTSFCAGYDRARQRYRNVVLTETRDDGTYGLETRYDARPVDARGRFIEQQHDRGTIGERQGKEGGFVVSGMEFSSFACPPGYEGVECRAKPLCRDPEDANRLKPLTFEQFNALRLYASFRGATATMSRMLASNDVTVHPRIRIRCLARGEYELETCADNKLLDPTSLKCVAYDVCEDRPNGYRHRYAVSESDASMLDERAYYVCNGNRSERRDCVDGTVFSTKQQRCITTNQCYGRGDATIAVDEKSYIACSRDTGRVVRCDEYVIIRDDVHSCHVTTCKPQTLEETTPYLRYAFGRVECSVTDEPVTTRCSSERDERVFEYTWVDKVSYSIEWPREVYRDGACRATSRDDDDDDPGIEWINETMSLAWTNAMQEAHEYNVRRHEYVCRDGEYRWDYARGVVIPEPPLGRIVDPGAPCRAKANLPHELAWGYAYEPSSVASWPKTRPPYLLVGVPVSDPGLLDDNATWPRLVSPDRYAWTVYRYASDRRIVVRENVRNVPPLGFGTTSDNDGSLTLRGFGARPSVDASLQWYTIATGSYDVPKTYDETTSSSTTTSSVTMDEKAERAIECPSDVSLNVDASYGICWRATVDREKEHEIKLPTIDATRTAMLYVNATTGVWLSDSASTTRRERTLLAPRGFVVMRVSVVDDGASAIVAIGKSDAIDGLATSGTLSMP